MNATALLDSAPMLSLDRQKMQEVRKALGLTQAEAAKRAGMSLGRWNDIETGRRGGNLQLETIGSIAAALEVVDPRDLITAPEPKRKGKK